LKPTVVKLFSLDENMVDLYFAAVHVLVGLLLATIGSAVLAILLPFVFIAERAMAVEAMGLEWASVRGDINDQLTWYLRFHPEQERVRIICITGQSLYRQTIDGSIPPLRPWAEHGSLDVILPHPNHANTLVDERFSTYTREFQEQHYPNGISDLVNEIRQGSIKGQSLRDRRRRASGLAPADETRMGAVSARGMRPRRRRVLLQSPCPDFVVWETMRFRCCRAVFISPTISANASTLVSTMGGRSGVGQAERPNYATVKVLLGTGQIPLWGQLCSRSGHSRGSVQKSGFQGAY
jgi:hypothetical protein